MFKEMMDRRIILKDRRTVQGLNYKYYKKRDKLARIK
jgi:hypothetical protein